ncbi:ABC transporter permease subunit [Mycoplasmopsis ciconiae]|uniref:ABC transporter permease subunit n=1 Tax=Mycoplasmopsis ciconiae TaxID=561067 RepID=A0ABU7MLE2_9BACT|nr:ABC transporter permease subunit [Mycoplasmopsis ciconiae]
MDKEIKLYNWYGESFDPIIPETTQTLKAYKHAVKVVTSRRIDQINTRHNIEKDLYLRARNKIEENQKRELSSQKVAYLNRVKVFKDSIKKLKYSDSIETLILFELKKLKKEKKKIQLYTKDFQNSLKTSADTPEEKEKLLSNLQLKVQNEQSSLFKTYAIYNILLKYVKSHKDNIANITKDNLDELKNSLDKFEIKVIEKNPDIIEKLNFILEQLNKSVISLQRKRKELSKEFNEQKNQMKKEYLITRKNIRLKNEQNILNLEYSFNQKTLDSKSEVLAYKKESKQKINEHKQQILSIENKNKNKLKNLKNKIENTNKAIKQSYKNVKKEIGHESMKLLVSNFNKFIESNPRFFKDYKKIVIPIFNSCDDLSKRANNDTCVCFQKNSNMNFLAFKKEILDKIKNSDNEKILLLAFKVFFSFNSYLSARKIASDVVKSKYNLKLSENNSKFSYQGKYQRVVADALIEKAIANQELLYKYNNEKANALISIDVIKTSNLHIEQKKTYLEKEALIKKEYKQKVVEFKNKIKSKEISKAAFKNKMIEFKIFKKESINELKLDFDLKKNKNILFTHFFRKMNDQKIINKIYESKVNEAQKSIPIEYIKNIRYLALFLGIIFPGIPELLIFKQYIKGVALSVVSLFIYSVILPFCFGAYWDKMGGVLGLYDLGSHLYNSSLGIFPDARYWLFGGVISILLLCFSLIYFLVSGVGSYRVAKALEEGSRPSKWSHTKRWLNTSGFPWMISLVGWALMIFIVATPVITSILISFTNYGLQHEAPSQTVDWVGLKNWGLWWIFRENNLLLSLSRVINWTIIWTILSTIIPISLGIIISVLVNNQRIKGKKIFRLIYILPWAIPVFVTITFIKQSFQAGDQGYINLILLKLGLIDQSIDWLNNITRARVLVIVVQTWVAYAWIFMLVTGNLQSIPKDIYEAGSVDGAKGRQLFIYLTLPQLLLSIAPMLIGQFVLAFNNFTTISLFTNGGPVYPETTAFGEASTDIIISWVYKITTGTVKVEGHLSFAAALTTLASLFSIALAAKGFIKSMRRRD